MPGLAQKRWGIDTGGARRRREDATNAAHCVGSVVKTVAAKQQWVV
jgi:hypothetical protein